MNSSLTISFIEAPFIGADLKVEIDTGAGIISLDELFVNLRQGLKQVTTGADMYDAAINLTRAWNADYRNYGSIGNLNATRAGRTIVITLLNSTWQFGQIKGSLVFLDLVVYNVNNVPLAVPYDAKLTSFESDIANPCLNALANFTAQGGTSLYRVYENNVILANDVASPFQLPFKRGSQHSLRITDSDGTLMNIFSIKAPRNYIENDISLFVSNFAEGATLNIEVAYISQYTIPLSYSLDNITFQVSNVFPSLLSGTYTVYVKDAFGCVVSKPIVIDGYTDLTETVFTISDINALHFAKVEEGKKNLRNTLSCNELKRVTYPFYHRFLADDIITTQLKTNAAYLNIYTIDSEGTTNVLSAVQKSNNTNLKAKSTSTYFDLGGGRSAIRFGLVDILDYTTETIVEQANFGFSLPEWANKEGSYVTISGLGQVKIDSISYSDTYDSFILEFNIAFSGVADRIISAVYNLQPYELFEFTTPMATDLFQVVIEAGLDADNIQFTFISEKIKQVLDNENLFQIVYSDDENKGDMVYQTGIQHFIRLEGQTDYIGEQTTEGYDGDTEFYSTENSVYTSERFYFPRLSTNIAHKLRLVMSHKLLNINGIDYKIAETPEINTNINNNSKSFSVLLKSGGSEFLSKNQEIISGSTESELGVGAIEASQGKSLILWTKQNG